MSDINWHKPNKDTQYEADATYLLDCGDDEELSVAVLIVDEEGGKLWYIEQEMYDFDDIKILAYAKCRNGKKDD